MTNLALTVPVPLAIDRDGDHFNTGNATHWIIKRWSGGRPGLLKDADGEPILLDIHSGKKELRRAVGHEPGVFRLYPSDLEGNVLDSLYAEIELPPGEYGQGRGSGYSEQVIDRLFGMLEQREEANRSIMAMMCDVLRSQASALIDQQRSSAEMLRAANETIKVANGVDALERQLPAPQVDVDSLASAVAEALDSGDDEDSEPQGKLSKFITSPMSGMLAGLVNGIVQPLLQLHQTRMKAVIDAETQKAGTAQPGTPAGPQAHEPAQPNPAAPATPGTPAETAPSAQAQTEPRMPEPDEPATTEPEPDELDDAAELDETDDADQLDETTDADQLDETTDADQLDDADQLGSETAANDVRPRRLQSQSSQHQSEQPCLAARSGPDGPTHRPAHAEPAQNSPLTDEQTNPEDT